MDMRVKVAAGLLLGSLCFLGPAQAAPEAPITEVRYACDEGQRLLVRESGQSAIVEFIDRTYELQRKHSSIGRKYIAPAAALIIDGASAVFVASDRLQLGRCVATDPAMIDAERPDEP